jgi:hypothetical protein
MMMVIGSSATRVSSGYYARQGEVPPRSMQLLTAVCCGCSIKDGVDLPGEEVAAEGAVAEGAVAEDAAAKDAAAEGAAAEGAAGPSVYHGVVAVRGKGRHRRGTKYQARIRLQLFPPLGNKYYDVTKEATLHLALRLRGGVGGDEKKKKEEKEGLGRWTDEEAAKDVTPLPDGAACTAEWKKQLASATRHRAHKIAGATFISRLLLLVDDEHHSNIKRTFLEMQRTWVAADLLEGRINFCCAECDGTAVANDRDPVQECDLLAVMGFMKALRMKMDINLFMRLQHSYESG